MTNTKQAVEMPREMIPLTKGLFAIVDREDAEMLSNFKWFSSKSKNHIYALCCLSGDTKVQMHRMIMNCPDGYVIDHINGNSLDNRKANLRICTHAENCRNQKKMAGSKTKKGVSYHKGNKRWRARIGVNQKQISLGCFDSEELAHAAYEAASKNIHGEYGNVSGRRIVP